MNFFPKNPNLKKKRKKNCRVGGVSGGGARVSVQVNFFPKNPNLKKQEKKIVGWVR